MGRGQASCGALLFGSYIWALIELGLERAVQLFCMVSSRSPARTWNSTIEFIAMLISGRSAGSASSTVFFIETQLRVASPTGRPEPAIYPKHATAENNMKRS